MNTQQLAAMRHTPGPWKAVYVGCGDWDLTGPVTQEDWTLAAAAPDLLEALRGVIEHWPVPSSICKDRSAYEAARAAISQAETAQGQESVNMTQMVDAAMVEMKNITPPLRRSECERLIRAALITPPAAQPAEWVGLTEEEINKLRHLVDWTAEWSYGRFAYELEQLLREKNGGKA